MEKLKLYENMIFFIKSIYIFSTAIICILIIYLPFYDTHKLFKSYITEKTFLFAAVTGVLMLLQTLIILFRSGKVKFLWLTWLDLSLFAFVSYVSLNRLFVSEMGGLTLKYYQLIVLCIFYIILRCIPSKYYQYFIYSLLVSAIIQAVYGNLQLYDIYPSNHHLFNITGSFFNPGPYSGYLSIIFPIALVLYLKNRKVPIDFQAHIKTIVQNILRPGFFSVNALIKVPARFQSGIIKCDFTLNLSETKAIIKQCFQKYLSLATIIAIFLVIPATRSRASWLAIIISSAYIGINEFSKHSRLLCYFNSKARKVLVGAGIAILVGVLLAGFYYFKKDSADGRLLIWKVSAGMIKDRPVFGFGFEKFQAHYMDYQASYFIDDPDNDESYVADNIIYPFNEYVKILVEIGIIGIILLGFTIFTAFSLGKKKNASINSISLIGGILGLMVFAFFSYPTEILPVILSLTVLLAILAEDKKVILEGVNVLKFSAIIGNRYVFKWALPILSVFIFTVMYFQFKRLYQAYFKWDEGYMIYQMGAYNECLKSFEESYDVLKSNGEYLIMYGKALSMARRDKESIEVLYKCESYQKNSIFYTSLGDSYKILGQVEKAEAAYCKAYLMIPSRFYAKYLLAKLYKDSYQYEKAVFTAKEILSKKEKIPSIAIEEIKLEMEKILKLGLGESDY